MVKKIALEDVADAHVEPLSKEHLAAPGMTTAPSKDSWEVGRGRAFVGKRKQDPAASPVSQPEKQQKKKKKEKSLEGKKHSAACSVLLQGGQASWVMTFRGVQT